MDSATSDCAALVSLVWRSVRISSVALTCDSRKAADFFSERRAEFPGALLDRGGGNVIGHLLGRGPGPDGVGENVEIGERTAVDEVERGGVIFGGFAGEAGDDVGADGGVGKLVANEFDRGARSVRSDTSDASRREFCRSRIAAACGSAGRCAASMRTER